MLLAGYGIDRASKLKPKYTIAQVQARFKSYFDKSNEVKEDFIKAWKAIDITKNHQINY